MADKDEKREPRQAEPRRESGEEQVDDVFKEANKKGFLGIEVDPTPNENYTVKGVTSGAPTPETDEDAARKARGHIERNRVR